jgi:hypothetical protein
VRLRELFYFSGFELADVGDEGVFAEVHLLITKEHKAIGINSEEVLGCEVELHRSEGIGLEKSLG